MCMQAAASVLELAVTYIERAEECDSLLMALSQRDGSLDTAIIMISEQATLAAHQLARVPWYPRCDITRNPTADWEDDVARGHAEAVGVKALCSPAVRCKPSEEYAAGGIFSTGKAAVFYKLFLST